MYAFLSLSLTLLRFLSFSLFSGYYRNDGVAGWSVGRSVVNLNVFFTLLKIQNCFSLSPPLSLSLTRFSLIGFREFSINWNFV